MTAESQHSPAAVGHEVEGHAQPRSASGERHRAVPHIGGKQHQHAWFGLDEMLRRQGRGGGDAWFAELDPGLPPGCLALRQGRCSRPTTASPPGGCGPCGTRPAAAARTRRRGSGTRRHCAPATGRRRFPISARCARIGPSTAWKKARITGSSEARRLAAWLPCRSDWSSGVGAEGVQAAESFCQIGEVGLQRRPALGDVHCARRARTPRNRRAPRSGGRPAAATPSPGRRAPSGPRAGAPPGKRRWPRRARRRHWRRRRRTRRPARRRPQAARATACSAWCSAAPGWPHSAAISAAARCREACPGCNRMAWSSVDRAAPCWPAWRSRFARKANRGWSCG